jgi:hypothetical protein
VNKKRIDQIMTSAFEGGDLGRLDGREAAELELARKVRQGLGALGKDVPECRLDGERLKAAVLASMSPAQRADFETSQRLHEGLEALREVPQHQLSNERLRDAILGSSVAPRRAYAGWNYAFGAVACAALALLALRYTGMDEPARTAPVADRGATESAGSDATTPPLDGQTALTATKAAEPADDRPVRQTERQRDIVAAVGPDYHDYTDPASFRDIARTISFSSPDETPVAPSAAEAAERSPIVVVETASTTDKGAARATETTYYGDVVFGG